MRLIILGASGQLGADVVDAAQRTNRLDVVALGRDQLDLADPASIEPALADLRFDALVNCAGLTDIPAQEQAAANAFTVNAYAVAALARACRRRGARLVHISSDYVFDGQADKPYTESDIPAPINVYGASKAMGEHLARMEDRQTLIVRVASLFGPRMHPGSRGNFVESIITKAQQTGSVDVVRDIYMSPTYTADAAPILIALLLERVPGGIYHVVNQGAASWYEFAVRIVRAAGLDARINPVDASQYAPDVRRPRYSVLSNRLVESIVGHIPHWNDALEQYVLARRRAGVDQEAEQVHRKTILDMVKLPASNSPTPDADNPDHAAPTSVEARSTSNE